MALTVRRPGRRRERRQRLRTVLLGTIGLGVCGLALAAYQTDLLRGMELGTIDSRFSIRGIVAPPRDIVVVAVDDITFDELRAAGRPSRWPFPRTLHARLIDRLRRDGARVIAYDIQFTEPSADPAEDLALYEAAGRARNVVFATSEVGPRGTTGVLGGNQNLRAVGARAAYSQLPNDPGGVLRRLVYAAGNLESFPVAISERATGRRVGRSAFPGEAAWIDYHGPPGTIETVSFSRAYLGKTRPGFFKGKIAIVGATAPTLQDLHPAPVGGSALMPGPEAQANAASTVRRGFPLRNGPAPLDLAAIALLGLLAPLASLRFSPLPALGLGLAAGGLYLVAAQLAFNGGKVLAVVYPIAPLVLGSVASLAIHYFTETRERRRLRALFSRFVPEAVVDQVAELADEDLRLGGVELDCTVLFSDVRGFTTFSESTPADQVIEVLNHYLGEMSGAILDNGGTLVAYMGDGIMAVFGAPISSDDHADRGLATAREMVGPRLDQFNRWMRDNGHGEGFRMGVGLNTGPVMSGNVGSERRLEYTTIGDTVNTAARLEGMTKGTPHQVFLADSTREALSEAGQDIVFVDELEVRGRQAKLKVWALGE